MAPSVSDKLRDANSLGRSLEAAGRAEDAMAAYRAALAVDPLFLPAATNLGRLLVVRESPREAVRLLEPVVAAAPFEVALTVNYANALLGVGRAVEAAERLRIVAAGVDAPAQANNSLGIAHYVRRDFPAARESFARAVRAAPDFAEAHENLAQALLQLGRYAEAWDEYEWRWKNPSNALTKRVFEGPLWDGTPLAGRTLLLHGEQGLGDTIQFVRYACLVPKERGRIVLACQEALAPLLRRIADIDEVCVLGGALPPFDCQAPLLSLPRLFGTEVDSIPDPSPYLSADPDPRIAAEPGLKIGVNWAGRPLHVDDPYRNRSCGAAQFLRLAGAGRSLYSLQLGDTAPAPIIDLGDRVKGFAATAEVIAALDLIVTIDTSVAHLAAAMGKPTWVLLPYAADWRWQAPWYRSVRTFRQPAPGDWTAVLDSVSLNLAGFLGFTNN